MRIVVKNILESTVSHTEHRTNTELFLWSTSYFHESLGPVQLRSLPLVCVRNTNCPLSHSHPHHYRNARSTTSTLSSVDSSFDTVNTSLCITRHPQLSTGMDTVETIQKIDYLQEYAGNRWFVLGAYFFAFFPWAILNNVDFISEKWRTCRRTRNLARIHIASSIFPIVYVAVYAEAQRRDGDNKELGAALAALMFNVFQLMRTIMGVLQLNAFVTWCKHAVECMRAL